MTRPHRANLGKPLELALNAQHARYEREGRASCMQIPTPYRVLARLVGGALKVAYVATGHPDYAVQAAGVSFLFDAKHTEGDRWPLKDLPEHQADRLSLHARHGGYSFVLVEIGGVTYLLPWVGPLSERYSAWACGLAKRGESSLTVADCRDIGIPLSGVDWLAAGHAVAIDRTDLF